MSLRTVAVFFGGLILSVAVVLLLMAWLFDYFASRAARQDVPPSPLAKARQIPPEPRLQVNAGADLKALRAAEDSVFNSYGWVDQPAGIVRIPIARAMNLLAQRGLPAPPRGPAKKAGKP
jgi:hypothetical protein